jgi:putative transposase
MRRARITHTGAYHHVMNRGHGGEDIYCGNKNKNLFLEILTVSRNIYRIKIFAFCIMDNHYHLVMENSSGKMSEFIKSINGRYGLAYRKKEGGRGYVFQSRYKSTLIQDNSYLMMSIGYVLLNPVKARIVTKYDKYKWSSSMHYFDRKESNIVDNKFVENLFSSKQKMTGFLDGLIGRELKTMKTKYGEILGSERFLKQALARYDRRRKGQSSGRRRIEDRYFEPVEKIIMEFEKLKGINIKDIDTHTFSGKRLRGELLVLIKELSGLKYTDIVELPLYTNLQINSLPKLYRDAKLREKVKK